MAFTQNGRLQAGICSSPLPTCSPHGLAPLPSRASQSTRLFANAPAMSARQLVPLEKDDLVKHIAKGCKPRDKWR